MRTRNSLNADIDTPCWATEISCPNTKRPKACTPYDCPFYKPEGAKDWVRIEDEDGINFIPPEEYYEKMKVRITARPKHSTWKITRTRK